MSKYKEFIIQPDEDFFDREKLRHICKKNPRLKIIKKYENSPYKSITYYYENGYAHREDGYALEMYDGSWTHGHYYLYGTYIGNCYSDLTRFITKHNITLPLTDEDRLYLQLKMR